MTLNADEELDDEPSMLPCVVPQAGAPPTIQGNGAQPGASGAGGRREGVRSTKEGKDLYRMIETLKLKSRTPDRGLSVRRATACKTRKVR